uniref:Peroxisomal biogenesis factor 3 n=1 Tax=Clastoptera arizonana TaxID=38151 RepID=A0A1B6CP06_9HEMI
MFASIKNFICRHRKKFIATGIVIGGTIMLTKYAQHKLIQWQEKEALAFLERTRKHHHFESTEQICNQTIISLSSTLNEMILKLLNTDELVETLRNQTKDKLVTWEELKIRAFAKVCASVYAGAMLVIVLRIQISIIGGYMYCDSKDGCLPRITNEMQEKYLSLCQFFLTEGIKELCILIENKVRPVLEKKSLKELISLQDVEQIFWIIQESICADVNEPIKNFSKLFLQNDNNFDGLMKQVMSDTAELLESEEVISLTTSCISRGFSIAVDCIAEFFISENDKNDMVNTQTFKNEFGLPSHNNFTNPNKVRMPMAKLVPIVSGLFGQFSKRHNSSDNWISNFIYMEKIKVLGANVYESFANPI